jgi:signal transduction histidine kinase
VSTFGTVDAQDAIRDAEIRALDLIGSPMPDALDHLVTIAATVTGAAVAEIHAITANAQHTLASTGEVPGPWPASDSYCARIVREPERNHLVPDVRADPRFKDSTFTTSGAVRTYAASQMVTSRGIPIGTLCIFDPSPREVDEQMMKVLGELSQAASTMLEARRQHEEMQGSLAELSDVERELRRSNEHLAAFAGQVSHDIQGPLATVVMALQMLEEDLEDAAVPFPEHRQMFLGNALSGAQRMRTR